MKCKYCNDNTLSKGSIKYCSRKCQQDDFYCHKVADWFSGKIDGLSGGVVTPFVKRWLREKAGNKCELCGWNKINQYTNKVPLVADHIDGIWSNNRPENLQLICPNCDSLQSTYKGANKGNGRASRLNHDK